MNLWDQKAKTYARYSKDLNEIQKQSFEIFKDLGIKFEDKTLIDIGCGTGVWTLHLAFLAKEVLALDSSLSMLEILSMDSQNLGLTNVKTTHLQFDDFILQNPKARFDIAFLSMSPSLQSTKDFEAFISLADIKIYLGWAKFRQSDFLAPIFKHFNVKPKKVPYEKKFQDFLDEKNIPYKSFIFDEKRIVKRSKEEALQNALWHLKMSDINADEKELSKLIKTEVTETISSKIKLLILS
ncbi:class I SAM-dependent methyltransferase [Campylobacter sp. MIT 99-7217]|uniref:class I SAM-dependent methyltransferase n=1 Tax=Campylobacter sp. MIT 99-7217 TaxID=535091 RepID=UPI0011580BEF|nr:class I SAM-dependent methyltransferase [Campylobacter sp. MIT 99-7217]TQR32461.1 class I SAM-dependent methyltransferase [Campylobacter sp. MIT 99-7217]